MNDKPKLTAEQLKTIHNKVEEALRERKEELAGEAIVSDVDFLCGAMVVLSCFEGEMKNVLPRWLLAPTTVAS